MKTLCHQSRIALFVCAVLLLVQISPARAGAPEGDRDKERGRVVITFTKWMTTAVHMAGITGGAVPGVFAGEVLHGQMTTNGLLLHPINALDAVYEVQDGPNGLGPHTFTALMHGGVNLAATPRRAVLDGVVLGGWRTSEPVRAKFKVISCTQAASGVCFQGTITVGDSED